MEDKIDIFQNLKVDDELSYRVYDIRKKTYIDEVEKKELSKKPKYHTGKCKIIRIYYDEDTLETLRGIDITDPSEVYKISFDLIYTEDDSHEEEYMNFANILKEDNVIYDKPERKNN